MSVSVLSAPRGTRIWVQETLDKEQSVEWSQALGGEGRGQGRDLAALLPPPEGSGPPSTMGCSQEGPGGSLAGDPLHNHPQGTSGSATPAWLVLGASMFLLDWVTGAFCCPAPCSPPPGWFRLIPSQPLQDTSSACRQGGAGTRPAASLQAPGQAEGHSCDMGLRPTGRDRSQLRGKRWGQLTHPGKEGPGLAKESLFQSVVAT